MRLAIITLERGDSIEKALLALIAIEGTHIRMQDKSDQVELEVS